MSRLLPQQQVQIAVLLSAGCLALHPQTCCCCQLSLSEASECFDTYQRYAVRFSRAWGRLQRLITRGQCCDDQCRYSSTVP